MNFFKKQLYREINVMDYKINFLKVFRKLNSLLLSKSDYFKFKKFLKIDVFIIKRIIELIIVFGLHQEQAFVK
jgi:hypothetical protein